MLGVHWARDHARPGLNAGADPHLVYHGGAVMGGGIAVQPIYWGTSWSTDTQSKMSYLAIFYSGVGGTSYMNTNKGNDTALTPPASSAVTYRGNVVDPSAAPRHAPRTSDVLAEVQKQVTAGQITPSVNGYYPVYVDNSRGGAGYCAWHSWGSVIYDSQSVPIQFGFFFNLDGDAGCNPQSPVTSYSQGVAALVNVSGHEISEVATDPRGSAWYDRSGYENADKCAWTFLSPLSSFGGYSWKIQSNWANAAYEASQGSPGGCVNS
jgi:hypothetical protein